MRKPPVQKATLSDFVQTAVRLPPELREQIKTAAVLHGRSMNAEMVARLENTEAQELRKEIAELRAMLREVLDIVRDKL